MKIQIPAKELLHKNQQYIYKNLKRFNVITAGRRFGKTRLAAFKIVVSALSKRGVYWWVSPSYGIGTPAWRVIKRLLRSVFGSNVKIFETTRIIELPNGSFIEFKSADNPDSLRGEGLSGVVIDEVAQVKEDAWIEAIRPAITDRKGWVIFIGTPKGRNWFYSLFLSAEKMDNWATFKFTSYDNPYIDPEEIEDSKLTMPELTFLQEHMAEFTDESGTKFLRTWFSSRVENTDIVARYMSWDTAQSTSDTASYSACTIAELDSNYRLHVREVWRGRIEFPQLQYEVERLAKKYSYKLKGIVIESKSSGLSLAQSLKQTLPPELANKIYTFNPKGDKEERAILASKWCELGMVKLPPPTEAYPWLFDFEEELFSFPGSANDDQVDSFVQMILFLANALQDGYKIKYKTEQEIKRGIAEF